MINKKFIKLYKQLQKKTLNYNLNPNSFELKLNTLNNPVALYKSKLLSVIFLLKVADPHVNHKTNTNFNVLLKDDVNKKLNLTLPCTTSNPNIGAFDLKCTVTGPHKNLAPKSILRLFEFTKIPLYGTHIEIYTFHIVTADHKDLYTNIMLNLNKIRYTQLICNALQHSNTKSSAFYTNPKELMFLGAYVCTSLSKKGLFVNSSELYQGLNVYHIQNMIHHVLVDQKKIFKSVLKIKRPLINLILNTRHVYQTLNNFKS